MMLERISELDSLPENWQVVTVDSVCTIKASAMTYKQLENTENVLNGIQVFGVKVSDMNLLGNETEFNTANLKRELHALEAKKRTIPEGAIVFPKRGAAIATNKKRLTTCQTVLDPNLIAIMPSYQLDNKYIFYWFINFDLRKITDPGPTPQLNKKDISPLRFPLPPLFEQKKIAHILSTVQRAIEAQESIIQTTTELKKALMQKLFTEGLRGEPQKQTEIGLVPESWAVKKVGEIATLKSGGTPSRKKPEFWDKGNIPWVKTGEVDYCTIFDTEEKITGAGLDGSSAKLFPAGTLLMAMYGQGITRGKVALLGIEASTNQACAAIFPYEEIDTKYLYFFFEYSYDAIRNFAHGANQKNLSADIIKSFPVSYPEDKKEQREIAQSFTVIDKKIKNAKKKKARLQSLFRTLLHELMAAKINVSQIAIIEN